jgi:hypothetical protein
MSCRVPSPSPSRSPGPSAAASPAAIVVAIAAAVLSGASFGVLVMDFGAHVDGPGIGLEWSRPLGSEYGLRAGAVLCAGLVQGGVSLTAFARSRARSFGVLALFGLAFVGMLVGFVGSGRALGWWWKLGCDRGHGYACYAAAGLADGDAERALDERACARDVSHACRRLVRNDPARLPAMCEARARRCTGSTADLPAFSACRSLGDICESVDGRR